MLTDFHLPYSTMLMMVAAFGGYENVMHAYEVAVEEGYQFGTYGDVMLIRPPLSVSGGFQLFFRGRDGLQPLLLLGLGGVVVLGLRKRRALALAGS